MNCDDVPLLYCLLLLKKLQECLSSQMQRPQQKDQRKDCYDHAVFLMEAIKIRTDAFKKFRCHGVYCLSDDVMTNDPSNSYLKP